MRGRYPRQVPRTRPFRFGCAAVPVTSRSALQERARTLEGGGWSTLLVSDHLGSVAAFEPLVSAADVTTGLRLGTLVINNDFFHHPLRLAQEAATVDLLSDGRLELGLGAGWNRPEYDLLELGYDRPRQRTARLAEAIGTMKAAWSGAVTLPGAEGPVRAVPAPVQRPHPPLLIGGHGDATLTLAGAEAEIVGLTGLTWTGSSLEATGASLESLAERAEFVCRQAGERAELLELNVLVQVVSVGTPLAEQLEEIASRLEIPADVVRQSPLVLAGTQSEVSEKLLSIREQTGISYFAVFGSAMEEMAPIVAELAGT